MVLYPWHIRVRENYAVFMMIVGISIFFVASMARIYGTSWSVPLGKPVGTERR